MKTTEKYKGNYEVFVEGSHVQNFYSFAPAQRYALKHNAEHGSKCIITNVETGKVWKYNNSKRRASLMIYSQSRKK